MQGVIAIPPSSSVTALIAVSTTLTFVMATTTVVVSTTLTKITAVYCSTVLCCYTSSVPLSPLDICSYSEYECSNGYCIPQSQRCDGYNDCWDNSDEYCSTSG